MGECVTVMPPAAPGLAPPQSASRMVRSADGKIRSDTGQLSVITDPGSERTIMIDHLKKEARIFHMPQQPPGAPMFGPPASGMPGAPPGSEIQKVEELGKSMIDGLEVVGRRYTLPPAAVPKPPSIPQAPGLPQRPGLPNAPAMPQPPAPPPVPTVCEVWTSTKFQLPVLTKTTGSFGEQVRRCRYAEAAHPSDAVFDIPPGYNTIVMPARKP